MKCPKCGSEEVDPETAEVTPFGRHARCRKCGYVGKAIEFW